MFIKNIKFGQIIFNLFHLNAIIKTLLQSAKRV